MWDADKIGDFQTLLCENQEYIQSLTSDVAGTSVDDTVQSFTRFLQKKAFQIFGKTFCQTNNAHSRQSNKHWFNEDCKTAKNEFTNARNIFNRTKNDHTRLKFTRARTKYNRVKKKAQQHHRIVEGQRLNDLAKKNTRKFWKHIRKRANRNTLLRPLLILSSFAIILKICLENKPNRTQLIQP